MTKHMQADKNIHNFDKLMNYLIDNKIKVVPNSSYVVFVENDEALNKMNSRLLKELQKEGRRVVKVIKPADSKAPWTFASA